MGRITSYNVCYTKLLRTLTVDDYFGAFGLNKITKLTLEPGMTKTGCYGANLIKEVIIPQGVKIITQNAFSGNPYTSIIIPESVDSIQGAAFSSSRITSINIPRGLTYLSASLFSHTDLTEFVIPNRITSYNVCYTKLLRLWPTYITGDKYSCFK